MLFCLRCALLFALRFFVCVLLFCLRFAFLFALCFFVSVVLFYLRFSFLFAFCIFVCVMLFCLRCAFLFAFCFFACVVLFCVRFLFLFGDVFFFVCVFFFRLRWPFWATVYFEWRDTENQQLSYKMEIERKLKIKMSPNITCKSLSVTLLFCFTSFLFKDC